MGNKDYQAKYQKEYRERTKESKIAYQKEWYEKNKEKQKEYQRKYRKDNKESISEKKRKYTLRSKEKISKRYYEWAYGIPGHVYNEMIASRGPDCPICLEKSPPVVDHCHKTGVVRGLICGRCNFALGHARDNPTILRRLADYLEIDR